MSHSLFALIYLSWSNRISL